MCLVSLAHNGSGVFGAKQLFLPSMNCVKRFRIMLKVMSFQGLVAKVRVLQSVTWNQSGLVGRCVQHLTSTHMTLY